MSNEPKELLSGEPPTYVFCLYIAGLTPKSQEAIAEIQAICKQHLAGRYELEIIDIYQQPELAKEAQIVAIPTLVRQSPKPYRKFIGNISEKKRILIAIGERGEDEPSKTR